MAAAEDVYKGERMSYLLLIFFVLMTMIEVVIFFIINILFSAK